MGATVHGRRDLVVAHQTTAVHEPAQGSLDHAAVKNYVKPFSGNTFGDSDVNAAAEDGVSAAAMRPGRGYGWMRDDKSIQDRAAGGRKHDGTDVPLVHPRHRFRHRSGRTPQYRVDHLPGINATCDYVPTRATTARSQCRRDRSAPHGQPRTATTGHTDQATAGHRPASRRPL